VANVGLGNVKFRLIGCGQHLETTLVFAPSFLVYLHHPHACSIIPCVVFLVLAPPNRRRWANLSVVNEKFGYMSKGMFAYCLGLLEQWPQL
jgi:hypothetical protein